MVWRLWQFVVALTILAASANAAPVYLGAFLGNDNEFRVENIIRRTTGERVDIDLYDWSSSGLGLTSFTPAEPLGALRGTWDVLDPGILISFLSVQAGFEFTVYRLDAPRNAGAWSTAHLVNWRGRQRELSHFSLWTVPTTSEVPEPSTAALLGIGLVALALSGLKRLCKL